MNNKVNIVPDQWTIKNVARYLIGHNQIRDHSFFMLDLEDLVRKIRTWNTCMPRVTPYFAVPCNCNPIVLEILAAFGAGFDCTSQEEINHVLKTGVPAEKIIFGNTVKMSSHIRHARKNLIDLLTFDGDVELMKIKKLFPEARLLLRICVNGASLSPSLERQKFGCNPYTSLEASYLMKLAFENGLKVVGICFHCGPDHEPEMFANSIELAANLFNEGNQIGHNMHILDIGGGFPGRQESSIEQISSVINNALDRFFPASSGVKIIAEPGRYFVTSAFTLASLVHSARKQADMMYFLDNGIYGSFYGAIRKRLAIEPELLEEINEPTRRSSLWGPTGDNADLIAENILLPPLPIPSWLLFHNFGAYTTYHGFTIPVDIFVTRSTWEELSQLPQIRNRRFLIPITVPTDLPQQLPPTQPTVTISTPPSVVGNVPDPSPLVKKWSPMYQILSPTSTDDIQADIQYPSTSLRLNISPMSTNTNLTSPREMPSSMNSRGLLGLVLTPRSECSDDDQTNIASSTLNDSLRLSPIIKNRGN